MRTIGVVTAGRSDYGHLRPVLVALSRRSEARTLLAAAGTHLDDSFGGTLTEIESDGYSIAARVETIDEGGIKRGPRPARLLFRTGASSDHPVASNCPEGEYLKAAWLTFDDPL